MDGCKYAPTPVELENIYWMRHSIDMTRNTLREQKRALTDFYRECDARKESAHGNQERTEQ